MKYFIRWFLLAAVAAAVLTGATCPPHNLDIARESPEKSLQVMRQALEKSDYDTAYFSLSDSTRHRYAFSHFKLMMEYTIFGILVKSMLINWNVKSVKYFTENIKAPDGKSADSPANRGIAPPKQVDKARVMLQHWKHTEYQKEFIFVYQDNGWRLDLTMAHVIGMPQEDEDTLFPVRTE